VTAHPAARAASPLATADGTPAGGVCDLASHLSMAGKARALVRGPGYVPVGRNRYLGPRRSGQRLVQHWGEWWWVPLVGCDDETEVPF